MLLDVIVQVIEGLDLLQLVDGDSNLVGCLHNGNEVYISCPVIILLFSF